MSDELRFPTSPVQTVDRISLDVTSKEHKFSYNFALGYKLSLKRKHT